MPLIIHVRSVNMEWWELLLKRHQEWIKFLKYIDAAIDSEAQLHLVVGNYATHRHRGLAIASPGRIFCRRTPPVALYIAVATPSQQRSNSGSNMQRLWRMQAESISIGSLTEELFPLRRTPNSDITLFAGC